MPHAPPLTRAFRILQAAVQHRDVLAEARAHQPTDPQRQRDFRHEHDRGLAARKRCFDRAEIHFRFAAAGHSVQQPCGEFSGHEPAPNLGQRCVLFGVEHVGRRREIRVPRIFAGDDWFFPREHHSCAFEPLNDESSDAGFLEQHFERKGPSNIRENLVNPLFGLADGPVRWVRMPGDNLLLS